MAKLTPAQTKVLINAFTAAWSKMDLPRWTSPQSDRPIDISDEEITEAFARLATAQGADLSSLTHAVAGDVASRRCLAWLKWAALAVVTTQAAELVMVGDEDDVDALGDADEAAALADM
jgi:hypothetical protein